MSNRYEIRPIQDTDHQAVLGIYMPYVLHTHITFEYEVPDIETFSHKIKNITTQYPWLVCLLDGRIAGYAYASEHRQRPAYKWSAESTIYLAQDMYGKGMGSTLYAALFDILKLQGFFNVYAGVGMPNDRSERLHKSAGFIELGTFKSIGYKLGKWHDTKWFQLHLQEHIPNPPPLLPMQEVVTKPEFSAILGRANEAING